MNYINNSIGKADNLDSYSPSDNINDSIGKANSLVSYSPSNNINDSSFNRNGNSHSINNTNDINGNSIVNVRECNVILSIDNNVNCAYVVCNVCPVNSSSPLLYGEVNDWYVVVALFIIF